jgi:hypothetical protein
MKESSFHSYPTAEATQPAVAIHHPVAGNDNRQRVSPQSLPYGSTGSRFAGLFRYPSVAPGVAVGNKSGYLPYLALKGSGAGWINFVGEVDSGPIKIGLEAFY